MGIGYRNATGMALLTLALVAAGGCATVSRAQQAIVDAADDRAAHVNAELAYAGFELRWPEVGEESERGGSAEFRSVFGERFRDEMDRRAPKALRGDRPARIVVVVADVRTPGALARGLAFQDPSMNIRASVRDAADEADLHVQDMKVVDRLPPDFSGAIQFRLGAIPDRLARQAVEDLVGWLRTL